MTLYIVTELGREKRCPRCGEYWPATGEFFWPRSGRRSHLLRPWCHACEEEYKAGWRKRRVAREVKKGSAESPTPLALQRGQGIGG